MTTIPKLTTIAACRIARIDRDRFNEHVSAGRFCCAPETIPGRTRLFDLHDMVALCLFRNFMEDDRIEAARAGSLACRIANEARQYPEAGTIAYVQHFNGSSSVSVAENVPPNSKWGDVLYSGLVIDKVTTYNIKALRSLILEKIEDYRSVIGEND